MSKLGMVEERREKRLQLMRDGHNDLVKDANGWWRPRRSNKNRKSYKKKS